MKAAVTKQLDQAVKDKHLTEAQKTKILADIDKRLDDIINGTRPSGRTAAGPLALAGVSSDSTQRAPGWARARA